ncbi:hypothetical protein HXZ94_05815 [Empedobacter falsenii]|uniref:hypothetical protein n=1 Tax=Empedobacter falsenii TaxID=343874 RepID=UPI0025764E38|nr:hypothetical protein [Empedobacter falsenii]MDM1298013.1 hypothetical protein [Empedobacter falsenii]MDM1317912.1 hypothetical protein [Empedobacter falsenii]
MIYSVIFAEGGLGDGFIYIIIAIVLGIAIVGGIVGVLVSGIVNSISGHKKESKYYLMVFGVCALITLVISGMVCGGM